MKVKELIEKLKEMNPEHLVLIPGYEGGYDAVGAVISIKVEQNKYAKEEWWWGDYNDAEGFDVIPAVYLRN